jgi:PAS domain S-box-containing protein
VREGSTGERETMRKRARTNAELASEIAALQERIFELEALAARATAAEENLLQAQQEISQQQAEIAALFGSFRAILQYRKFTEAARAIFDACKSLIGATAGYVGLLSADGQTNEVLLLDSGNLPCAVDPSLPMPVRGLRARAYRSGTVVYDNDFSRGDWTRFLPEGHVQLDNVLFAPLVLEGKALGIVGLANKLQGFTENDARLASAFGELAAVALQNSRALEALERSQDELEHRVAERTAALSRTNVALAAEIGDRVKAERLLQERNELLESMFAHIHFLIAYMDAEFNFIRVNRAYAAAAGRNPEFYVGKNHFALFPDEENETIFRRVVETGLPHFAVEKAFVSAAHPEREVTYWDWSLQAVKDAESKVRGLILGLVDVTERRRAQIALQASDAKYSTLVENSLIGIFINMDGRIVFANDRFAEIFGYSRDELMGTEALRLVHPEDRALVEDTRIKRLRGEPVPAEYESRGLTKRGETIWVIRRNTVIDYQGRRAVLGNLVDVTKRRHMEEALRQSERNLRHLSAQLLNAQETERGRIARELHDGIGQGLSAIKFRLEDVLQQMRRGETDEGCHLLELVIPLIRKAIEETRRISMDLRPATLDGLGILATVSWLCREFQGTYRGVRIENEITVREEEVPENLKVVIYRILQEALNNVAKHSRADLIRIHLRKQAGRIELSVRDNGTGFEPMRVLAKQSGKIGYGLTSMRERSELSGGSFFLESDRGKGTLVRASWPIR